jgi:TPP-dependent pyruvate/acetoin dehydrogenase alpha subunit
VLVVGKHRSKKEVEEHTNHHDPGGHTRKTTQKLINSHEKEKQENKEKNEKAVTKKCKFLIILHFTCTN